LHATWPIGALFEFFTRIGTSWQAEVLTDAPKPGVVKVGHMGNAMGMRLSRADLAEFMLKQVQDAEYLRQAPAISN